MGARKAKPPRTPGGGRTVVQHFIFKTVRTASAAITISGSAQAILIPSGAPLPPAPPQPWVGTGGVRVSGTAGVSTNIAQHFQGYSHGGITIGGSAPASKNNIPLPTTYAWHPLGGVVVRGSAPASSTVAQQYGRVGTGGVKVAGSAVVTSSLKQRYNPITGGLILVRGSAIITRVINAPGGGGGAFTTPVAPATFDPSRNPAHFTSEVVAASFADIQNKIDTSPPGTRIRVPLGVDWMGSLTLRNRGFGANQWIEIAPDLPHATIEAARPYGRRMNPGIASALNLPTLRTPGGNASVVYCDPAAAGYRFTGINFRMGGLASAMVRLGYTDMASAAEAAKRLVVDRCTAIGGATYPCNRAFYCVGEQVGIVGTWIADIYGAQDTQGILILGWQGPYYVRWNRIEGWTENWMAGGGETAAGGVASDVTFWENYVVKNMAYRYNPPLGATVKNLLEAKSVRRASVKYNIFEYDWSDGQPFPVILKSVNQGGQQPQQGTTDYEVAYNWFRKIPAGVNMAANPEGAATPMKRVYLHDNLFEDINTLPDHLGTGIMLQFLGGLSDITLDHNTFVRGQVGDGAAIGLEGSAVGPIALRSNIFTMGGYNLKRSDSAGGTPSWNAYVPDPTNRIWQANALVTVPPDEIPFYPAGSISVANDGAVGYEDYAARNYRVLGPLASAGHDGGPVGISDVPAFYAALANVQNG